MSKVALVASFAALAVSGGVAWKTWCPSCRAPAPAEAAPAADGLVARLDAVEKRLEALESAPRPATVGPAAASGTVAESGDPGLTGRWRASTAPGAEAPKTAATMEEVEKRIAALEEAREKDRRDRTAFLPAGMRRTGAPGFLASTEDAQRELELTDGQKADFDRVVADAKRDLDALRKIPDDEGKTWEQAQREMMTDLLTSATGGSAKIDLGKLTAFRAKPIPGRGETFGQADQRIRDDAKRRMRDSSTTAQQEKFDKAVVDPLLGGMGGPSSFVTLGVMGDPAKPPK